MLVANTVRLGTGAPRHRPGAPRRSSVLGGHCPSTEYSRVTGADLGIFFESPSLIRTSPQVRSAPEWTPWTRRRAGTNAVRHSHRRPTIGMLERHNQEDKITWALFGQAAMCKFHMVNSSLPGHQQPQFACRFARIPQVHNFGASARRERPVRRRSGSSGSMIAQGRSPASSQRRRRSAPATRPSARGPRPEGGD